PGRRPHGPRSIATALPRAVDAAALNTAGRRAGARKGAVVARDLERLRATRRVGRQREAARAAGRNRHPGAAVARGGLDRRLILAEDGRAQTHVAAAVVSSVALSGDLRGVRELL